MLLDRVTIDTTDGSMSIVGTGDPGAENPVDIDVPVLLDRVTIDTTDGSMVVVGDGNPGFENPVDIRVPTLLDRTTIDTTTGDFVVSGSGEAIFDTEQGTTFNGHSKFGRVTINTDPGKFYVHGSNDIEFDANVDMLGTTVSAREVLIDTFVDKGVTIQGSGLLNVATESYFYNHANFSQMTVDTTNGQMLITSNIGDWSYMNPVRINVPLITQSLTASTNKSHMLIKGSNDLQIESVTRHSNDVHLYDDVTSYATFFGNNINIDGETLLDKTTIDTTDGDMSVTGPGQMHVTPDATFDSNVHIKGDLRVDGNAWLSAGVDGNIYVGDHDGDNVVFHADINSDLIPNITNTYSLGVADKRWLNAHAENVTTDHIHVE
ncbi:MAG: hypothetical protein EBY62_12930, partial [Cellvibrionales bacterium]|nr:hypothetical protein [Cellvibrionales bacterium]